MNPVRADQFEDIQDQFTLYYVYVLQNARGFLYTGFTTDLRKRLDQHVRKHSNYTKYRGPYRLIYFEASLNKDDATSREEYLKTGMGKRYLKNRLKRFLALTG